MNDNNFSPDADSPAKQHFVDAALREFSRADTAPDEAFLDKMETVLDEVEFETDVKDLNKKTVPFPSRSRLLWISGGIAAAVIGLAIAAQLFIGPSGPSIPSNPPIIVSTVPAEDSISLEQQALQKAQPSEPRPIKEIELSEELTSSLAEFIPKEIPDTFAQNESSVTPATNSFPVSPATSPAPVTLDPEAARTGISEKELLRGTAGPPTAEYRTFQAGDEKREKSTTLASVSPNTTTAHSTNMDLSIVSGATPDQTISLTGRDVVSGKLFRSDEKSKPNQELNLGGIVRTTSSGTPGKRNTPAESGRQWPCHYPE